jgi:serine/threonine protein kinase
MRQEQTFDYEVIAKLGVGMFGEVSKVRRNSDGKEFALKILKEDMIKKSPRILQMLSHEVTGLIGKYHPNMVTLYDAFKINDDNFLIYELCEPESMKTRLRSKGCWTEQNIIELAKPMLLALHYLHGLGIIHRDIKPDNILLRRGQYKLADFGLCYRGGYHYDNDLIGSPAYLAPEIFKRRFYSEKSDVYALGISLYEMYTGKYPFEQKNEQALIKRKMEFLPSKDNMKGASDAFVNMLRMMVLPNFEKRASIEELLTLLNLDPTDHSLKLNPNEDEFQIGNFGPAYNQGHVQDLHTQNYYQPPQLNNGYDQLYPIQTPAQPVYDAFDNYIMPQQEPVRISNFTPQEFHGNHQANYMYQQQPAHQYPMSMDNHQFVPSYPSSSQENMFTEPSTPTMQPQDDNSGRNYNNLFNFNMYDRMIPPKQSKPFMAVRSIFTDELTTPQGNSGFTRHDYTADQRNRGFQHSTSRKETDYNPFSRHIQVSREIQASNSPTDRAPNLINLHSQLHNVNMQKLQLSNNLKNTVTRDDPLNMFQLRNSSFGSPQTTTTQAPSFHRADTLGVPATTVRSSDRSYSTQPTTARNRKAEASGKYIADPFTKDYTYPSRTANNEMPLTAKKDYNNLLTTTLLLPQKPAFSSNRVGTASTNNLMNLAMPPASSIGSKKYSKYLENNSENTPTQGINRSFTSEFSNSTAHTNQSGDHTYHKAYTMGEGAAQPSYQRSRDILPTGFSNQQFSMAMLNSQAAQDEAKQIMNEITAMNDHMLINAKHSRTRKGGNLLL